MGIANACCRVRAGARARSGCSAWSGCPCMRTERPRASLTSVPAHDPRSIPQRGATHTKIGPPRRARVDARDARERTSHGPRSASSASAAAEEGGPPGSARPTARAPSRRAPTKKSSKIYQPFPTSLPLMVKKKKLLRGQKKSSKISPPLTTIKNSIPWFSPRSQRLAVEALSGAAWAPSRRPASLRSDAPCTARKSRAKAADLSRLPHLLRGRRGRPPCQSLRHPAAALCAGPASPDWRS